MVAVRLMARTLRGLEDVAADEVVERGFGRIQHRRHREVWFYADGADHRLLDMRTVDDLFLLAAVVEDVRHTKENLVKFADAARSIDLSLLMRQRAECGNETDATGVDVVASFLGKRNYNRYDIEDAVGTEVANTLGLPYHSRRGGASPPENTLSFRVTIEGTQAGLALRIGAQPLHRRPYKQSSTPGTLHPPLAAAMSLLAHAGPADTLFDPCCGTGTILIETAGLAPEVRLLGADSDQRALAAATDNAASMATSVAWLQADAGRLPVGTGQVDRIVSNPPWGRQVLVQGTLAAHPERLYREIRRTLSPTGRAVLLLHEADEQCATAQAAGLRVREIRPLSLFGAHPSVVTLTG